MRAADRRALGAFASPATGPEGLDHGLVHEGYMPMHEGDSVSRVLRRLRAAGLIESTEVRGWYRITSAGRDALTLRAHDQEADHG